MKRFLAISIGIMLLAAMPLLPARHVPGNTCSAAVEGENRDPKPDKGEVRFLSFKCPFFPDGYAIPESMLIKFFSMRTHYSFGNVKKIVFTIHTNRQIENVKFKLYSGIPKNPLAVLVDLTPTAEVEGVLRDNEKIIFDSLDIMVPPGYPNAFLLKVDTNEFSRGDWANITVALCEAGEASGEMDCQEDVVSRKISFLF